MIIQKRTLCSIGRSEVFEKIRSVKKHRKHERLNEMETAVQPPASYVARDPCHDQAGPSGSKKSCSSKKSFENARSNSNVNNAVGGNAKRRGSFGNTYDKCKRRRRHDAIVPPTKFLLGGNITDPLNLKSLENEEVNRLANRTPVASPAPTTNGEQRVEVIIPQNINDPLNLNGPEPVVQPPAPVKKNRRRRKRNNPAMCDTNQLANQSKIVNQVEIVNQPKAKKTPQNGQPAVSQTKQNQIRFRFGNYNRYYGYRNGSGGDSRIPLLKEKWFKNKVCLDIGCNIGNLTLSICRDYKPKQMIGLDIDPELVRIAKKNVRHYVHQNGTSGKWFPVSCPMTFGPLTMSGAQAAEFPHNVFFICGNYVLENEEQLQTQCEEFDTIMCLSTSKWIQLNFGDEGLKRAFRRVFKQLRPGGRFVFEPQPLTSYRKLCTPEHRENFREMQLKPDDFADYLVKEVGFASFRRVAIGVHDSKGFQRPLYLFKKAKVTEDGVQETPKPSPARECDTTTASI